MSKVNYKYSEDKILGLLSEYIDKTYNEHYAAKGVQTVDVWEGLGIAAEACQSNVLKYAMRLGRKDGHNPKDMMKILHYTILWYHYTFLAGKNVPVISERTPTNPAVNYPAAPEDMGPLVSEVSEILQANGLGSFSLQAVNNGVPTDEELKNAAIMDEWIADDLINKIISQEDAAAAAAADGIVIAPYVKDRVEITDNHDGTTTVTIYGNDPLPPEDPTGYTTEQLYGDLVKD